MTPRTAAWHVARLLLLALAAVVTASMLPGARVVPDLVLPLVVAAGFVRGPWAGVLVGLLAGWLSDAVPPTAPVLGTGALVYAVAGLVGGAYNRPGGHWRLLPHVAMLSAVPAAVLARLLLALVLDERVDVGQVLLTGALTLVLGLGVIAALTRLEVLGAPSNRAWGRGPR